MKQLSLFPFFKKKKKNYGLSRNHLPKNKRWLAECDYADKLSEHDKLWLDLFNREFNEGAIKKGDGTALHYTDELRKEAYRDNTRRCRDLYAIKQCGGALFDLDHKMGIEAEPEESIDSRHLSELEYTLLFHYHKSFLEIHHTHLLGLLQSFLKPACTVG